MTLIDPSIHPRVLTKPWTSALLLSIFTLLLLAPFVAKPFHIDDPIDVWVAQQIAHHPFDFYGFHFNWMGIDQPVSQFYENPPLNSYILALASLVVGWSEAGLHAAILPFNLLTILGTYFLAGRFCRRPVLAAGLLLLAPVFLVSATTVMCEPAMLCFWIWAIVLWIRGGEKNSPTCILLAGLIAALAILTKFIALAVIPLLILHAILWRSPLRIRLWQCAGLLIPLAAVIGYQMYTSHLYGTGSFTHAAHFATDTNRNTQIPLILRLSDTMAFIGGGTASACIVALLLVRRRVAIAAIAMSILLAFIAAGVIQPPVGWRVTSAGADPRSVQFSRSAFWFFVQYSAMMVGFGIVIGLCIHALRTARRPQDFRVILFLGSWILGIVVFAGLVNWSINARSILPLIPPLCILLVRSLDHLQTLPKLRMRAGIAIAGLLAVSVTAADYKFAVACRDAVQPLLAVALPLNPPNRIWFGGHWGFQYYMQAAGVQPLDVFAPQYKVGDTLILPTAGYGGPVNMQGLRLIRKINVGPDRWLSTIQLPMGAGFYISYGYHLPFVFGPIKPEEFVIVEITPATHLGHTDDAAMPVRQE